MTFYAYNFVVVNNCILNSQVITFDAYGVSGHCNHIDTHYGVKSAIKHLQTDHSKLELFVLESVNVFRKFSGWMEWIFAVCHFLMIASAYMIVSYARMMDIMPIGALRSLSNQYVTVGSTVYSPVNIVAGMCTIWAAMGAHASQLLWYRRIFIVLSSYSYINVLEPATASDAGAFGLREE